MAPSNTNSSSSATRTNDRIDAREFDPNRSTRSHVSQRSNGARTLLDDDVSFMGEVADGIIERDRKRMRKEVTRWFGFVCAVTSCLCAGSITSFSLYGPRFLKDLHYTQYRVNAVSVTAELAMYLPVPLFGYLCDRYSPPPLSLLSAALFGSGYLLAAYTYKAGPPPDSRGGGDGFPFGIMLLAFILIGSGTSCMYLCSVATCAKNFAHSKYRGFMLAVPIAAFGLSGMWQSQVGALLLSDRLPNGQKGSLNVFKYFVFLATVLIAVGLLGTFGLQIVNEEEMIEHGVEQLEASGLLDESEFFQNRNYGSFGDHERIGGNDTPASASANEDDDGDGDDEANSNSNLLNLSESLILKKQEEEALLQRKKSWLLNHATSAFLSDRTMWLLAAGFFLITGPGETYINNIGTIIPTLTPPKYYDPSDPPAGRAETHVSIIALASTFARLFTGSLSDLFAPPSNPDAPPTTRASFSRLVLLLPSSLLLLLCFLIAALPFLAAQIPSLFLLCSALLGFGYGACFSLVPIITSVVWGVENFATNWGIVAMMPAAGAAVWSLIYSVAYSTATDNNNNRGGKKGGNDAECKGYECFGPWAAGCTVSVAVAIGLWTAAWMAWKRRNVGV